MFAIGHEDLVTGGQEIISGGGNVGQALFATGAGLVRLQSIQEQLLQECEALFKPSGSKPVINSTVSSLKDVRQNQKAAQLPAKDWKSHHRALGAARQQLEKVRQKLTQSKQLSSRLERIRQALPLMARKKEIDAERVDYEGVPELPEDFGDKRREIENKLKFAESDLKRANETIQGLNKQINLLAKLESDVEKYARLKIASIILARTIEQYREKHQGPLIKRASELFSQMTIGSFSGVRAEYDDKGSPVLVGIRPGSGQQVPVAGMSDGTADQLYLALRLASLEQYLENNEPLPFVVDDILLRFDDQRALATLNVLAGLSEKTQVIFFTHHRHLVDLADEKIDSSLLLQHTL